MTYNEQFLPIFKIGTILTPECNTQIIADCDDNSESFRQKIVFIL